MVGMAWRFRLISCVILVILLLQSFAVLFRTHAKGWPFIDYPMYSPSLEDGDRLEVDRRLYATLADTTEVRIGPEDIGLDKDLWWVFRFWIVRALEPDTPKRGEKSASWLRDLVTGENGLAPGLSLSAQKTEDAAVSLLVNSYRQRHGKEIVALRLEDEGIVVTRAGMKTTAARVLWSRTLSHSPNGD